MWTHDGYIVDKIWLNKMDQIFLWLISRSSEHILQQLHYVLQSTHYIDRVRAQDFKSSICRTFIAIHSFSQFTRLIACSSDSLTWLLIFYWLCHSLLSLLSYHLCLVICYCVVLRTNLKHFAVVTHLSSRCNTNLHQSISIILHLWTTS